MLLFFKNNLIVTEGGFKTQMAKTSRDAKQFSYKAFKKKNYGGYEALDKSHHY